MYKNASMKVALPQGITKDREGNYPLNIYTYKLNGTAANNETEPYPFAVNSPV